MSSTTTSTTTLRDKLNSPTLGKEADAIREAPLGDLLSLLLDVANPGTSVPATTVGGAVANTGVQSPANASYTQADQTALATCALALVVQINLLRTDVLALRAAMATALTGVLGGMTETSVTVTSNKAVLAQAPTQNGLFVVNGTTGTHTGVKQLVRDPTQTLATGQVYWDGGVNITFAAIDAITVCDLMYSKSDLTQKASVLMRLVSP
jgi:hypothetical protein